MKKTNVTLRFEELTLRPLAEHDLADTLNWRNHPENRKWFHDDSILTAAKHMDFFADYLQRESDFIFIVENQHANKVGQASIYHINSQAGSGEFGRFLANPDYRGQGFMRKACLALLEFSSAYLNLNQIYLEVKADNDRAIRIYHDTGFSIADKKSNVLFMKKFLCK
jgi:RimJ/RimL family protein N-acetyltransferase